MKQFVDEVVGYVLDFLDEEQLILIHNSLRNPPFTWIVELHPPYFYNFCWYRPYGLLPAFLIALCFAADF